MFLPISCLKIPESQVTKFYDLGFYYCEDVANAFNNKTLPESLLTIIQEFQLLNQLNFKPANSSVLHLWKKQNLDATVSIFHEGLDTLLNGGIKITNILEFCGAPGVGKTQICLQLCVDVQVPKSLGGSQGEAIYISTDNSFRVGRLTEIAQSCLEYWKSNDTSIDLSMEKLLNGVHVLTVLEHNTFINTIKNLETFLKENNKIKLLIIDSFSFIFINDISIDTLTRTRLVHKTLDILSDLAEKFKFGVVLTNQLTTVVHQNGESQIIPCLGNSFAHRLNQRIMLADNRMCIMKSIDVRPICAKFEIEKAGLR